MHLREQPKGYLRFETAHNDGGRHASGRAAPSRAPAGRRSAEEVFWRAEPSRNPAYSAGPSTSPSPSRFSCDKPRLSTDSAATGCPSPRRTSLGTSERLKHSHAASFRRTEALLAHFGRRSAGFHSCKSHAVDPCQVGLCAGRGSTLHRRAPPAEPPQVDGRAPLPGCTEQPGRVELEARAAGRARRLGSEPGRATRGPKYASRERERRRPRRFELARSLRAIERHSRRRRGHGLSSRLTTALRTSYFDPAHVPRSSFVRLTASKPSSTLPFNVKYTRSVRALKNLYFSPEPFSRDLI